MKPKETRNVNEEESDSDYEDDMADIKAKKTRRKLSAKNSNRKENSCQPNRDLKREESDDDSDVEGVKSSQSEEEQKLENNFDTIEYKKGSGKKATKKTNKGNLKESKSDGNEMNCFGTGENDMMDLKKRFAEGNKKKVISLFHILFTIRRKTHIRAP